MINDSVLVLDAATGRVKVTTGLTWQNFGGGTPIASTGELAVRATPPVVYLAGLGYDAAGNLCVSDGAVPDGYVGGLAVAGGCVCVTGGNAIAGYVGGIPVDAQGRICAIGLSDQATLDFRDAVQAAGGTLSPTTLAAVDTFVKAAKAGGFWAALLRVNLFCGDQLAAALTPLKAAIGTARETAVNIVEADYSEAQGLKGDGSSKYLRTGVVPSTHLAGMATNLHLSFYNRENVATAVGAGYLGVGGNPPWLLVQFARPDGQVQWAITASNSNGLASPRPYGHLYAQRIDSANHEGWRNGVLLQTAARAVGALPAFEMFVLAVNEQPFAHTYGQARCGGYSIGNGMTPAQVLAFYNAMQAFQTSLARAV